MVQRKDITELRKIAKDDVREALRDETFEHPVFYLWFKSNWINIKM